MKMMKLDDNAHALLSKIKIELEKEGIENPTFSEAVRHLYRLCELSRAAKTAK